MEDSDDEYDRRWVRDKFWCERSDYIYCLCDCEDRSLWRDDWFDFRWELFLENWWCGNYCGEFDWGWVDSVGRYYEKRLKRLVIIFIIFKC